MNLIEVRKEDDLYYNGVFWVIADSFKDILNGEYKLVGIKYLVDFNGDEVDPTSKNSKTHYEVWNNNFKNEYNVNYTYYPRGRVNIYNGEVYINLNSKLMNQPNIINDIYKFYDLSRFKFSDIKIFGVDKLQGPHYDFELK